MAIKIDQTLHGYASGHSLLQSSARLSSEAERSMLALSDMSGPGMRPGFESYLTAYPLPADQAYVVARTWYAPEMQRPGCVWTHSLIIRNDDIGSVRDARTLLRLFRRPESTGESNSYSSVIALPHQESEQALDALEPLKLPKEARLEDVLWSLYGVPDKPVYVVAGNADQYESLTLQLWSQQWPHLRLAFSYCTGALANRSLRGKPLDLQVVPWTAVSELRQELARGTVIDPLSPSTPVEIRTGRLVAAAAQDLASNCDCRVRETAWKLAAKTGDRSSFLGVFYLASALERSPLAEGRAHDLVDALATVTVEAKLPDALKEQIFGANDDLLATLGVSDSDLLRELSTVKIEGFNASELDVATRAQRLFKTDRKAALALLSELIGRDIITEVAGEILVAICRALEPEDLDSIVRARPHVLPVVIKQKPQLASSLALWKVHPNLQTELFHTLMSSPVEPSVLQEVVGTILQSRTAVVPEHAPEYGDRLVIPVLDWLNSNSSVLWELERPWIKYLRNNPESVVGWLRGRDAHPPLLVLIARSLPADTAALNSVGLRTWVPLLVLFPSLGESDAIEVATFLFALGLRHCDKIAIDFVRETFEVVHGAAATENFDYEYWRPIESVAPPLHWWREWDKCERIRLAMLERFISCDWPNIEFLRAVKNASTLEHLFGLWDTSKLRKRFLKRTAKAGLELSVAPDYYRVLKNFD